MLPSVGMSVEMRFVWMPPIHQNASTHAPRYEFYSCKRTKKVQKPTPRYDPNFGK